MPFLVLTGEKASGTFLIEQAKLIATNVSGKVVQDSGHWLMEEAPDQVIPRDISVAGFNSLMVAAALPASFVDSSAIFGSGSASSGDATTLLASRSLHASSFFPTTFFCSGCLLRLQLVYGFLSLCRSHPQFSNFSVEEPSDSQHRILYGSPVIEVHSESATTRL
jgi:hypothetical protein